MEKCRYLSTADLRLDLDYMMRHFPHNCGVHSTSSFQKLNFSAILLLYSMLKTSKKWCPRTAITKILLCELNLQHSNFQMVFAHVVNLFTSFSTIQSNNILDILNQKLHHSSFQLSKYYLPMIVLIFAKSHRNHTFT